jgi:hypothetical protein
MASDHRIEATDDDRVDVDVDGGGRAQDGRLLQNVSVLMCSRTPPEQRNHRHSATRGIER